MLRMIGMGCLTVLLLGGAAHAASSAQDTTLSQKDEIAELKRIVSVLTDEVADLRERQGVPEELELESQHGLGPAASKVYGALSGISIGGYAEGYYQHQSNGDNTADMLRTVLYVGYKYSDRLIFNTEIEFEHATTGPNFEGEDGSVSVEFATLDYMLRDELNFRAGLVLVPMGLLNEYHEPPFYFGTHRPEVDKRIIPTTWRENGAGIFGRFGETLSYRVFVIDPLLARGFDAAGLREGRQKGNRVNFDDPAFVARVDLEPVPGLMLGGSYYYGEGGAADAENGNALPDVPTTIWEVHAKYDRGPLQLRGNWAQAHVGDARELSTALALDDNRAVSRRSIGGYAEAAYDVMPLLFPSSDWGLEPFFRFEYIDTQNSVPSGFDVDGSERARIYIPGINLRPHPNVVLKFDYRNIDDFAGDKDNELNFGFGVVF